ncbi:TPA: ParA family protein [Escherichia coli]
MAVTVGFISEKGGVGKTTSCYHIAEGLSRFHEKRVLVIDADYQRGGITGRFFPKLIENFGNQAPQGTTAAWRLQIENRPGSSCCCRTPRRICML